MGGEDGLERGEGDNVIRRQSTCSSRIYKHIDLPADITDTDVFADNEVY